MSIRPKFMLAYCLLLVFVLILILLSCRDINMGLLLLFSSVCLITGLVMIMYLSSGISAPIGHLREFTEQLSTGDFSKTIALKGSDEITLLADALNRMATRFRETVNSLELAVKNLHEKQGQLVEAEKLASLGRIAAGVAHEINNPLAIINEKAGLMQDMLEMIPAFEHREQFLAQIKGITASINRCRSITHRLLGFARRIEITIEPMNLNEAIRETIIFLQSDILSKMARLTLNLADGLPEIRSDKIQLEQVFLNLIKNAVDAISEGGEVTVTTSVSDDNTVQVMVSDNGPGIPPDMLRHIFEPFFTTKERGQGTGLGLFVSHAILKKLGSGIEVKSIPGRGTTFIIHIPVKPSFPRETTHHDKG